MQDCNLEVNNLMKDNCVEPTLSFSLVKETSIFHGQEWWQGHGPGSTQAPVGPGWRWFPHSSQCRSRRGFPTCSPMIDLFKDPSFGLLNPSFVFIFSKRIDFFNSMKDIENREIKSLRTLGRVYLKG